MYIPLPGVPLRFTPGYQHSAALRLNPKSCLDQFIHHLLFIIIPPDLRDTKDAIRKSHHPLWHFHFNLCHPWWKDFLIGV